MPVPNPGLIPGPHIKKTKTTTTKTVGDYAIDYFLEPVESAYMYIIVLLKNKYFTLEKNSKYANVRDYLMIPKYLSLVM